SIDGAKKLPEGLGSGDVVEVSCVVSPKRIRRGEFCRLPSPIGRWIARQKRCERLVCEAVRKKSRALLWKAFLASPVIGKRRSARGAFEELLVAHGQHFEDWR
ncbi:MAG TPA: hypothetical protein ENF73_00295, partial [Proteobacteria bacterium]|nr:hypothetical protein [Pseudomonadota bacterium]